MSQPNKDEKSGKKRAAKRGRYAKPLLIAHGSILLAATRAWAAMKL